MSASTVASGLTPDDRVLLRSVFAWARANGWSPVQTDRHDRQWSAEADHGPVLSLVQPNYGDNGEDSWGPGELRVHYFDGSYRCVSVPKTSPREAVDVLVALGILPAHLSSSWLAGRESVYDRAEFRVTTPDGQRPGSNGPMYSVVDAFKTLGFWRRNGWHDAYLEKRWGKEPGDWERVSGGDL